MFLLVYTCTNIDMHATHISIYMTTRKVKLRGLRPPKYKQNRARPNHAPKTIITISTTTKNNNDIPKMNHKVVQKNEHKLIEVNGNQWKSNR